MYRLSLCTSQNPVFSKDAQKQTNKKKQFYYTIHRQRRYFHHGSNIEDSATSISHRFPPDSPPIKRLWRPGHTCLSRGLEIQWVSESNGARETGIETGCQAGPSNQHQSANADRIQASWLPCLRLSLWSPVEDMAQKVKKEWRRANMKKKIIKLQSLLGIGEIAANFRFTRQITKWGRLFSHHHESICQKGRAPQPNDAYYCKYRALHSHDSCLKVMVSDVKFNIPPQQLELSPRHKQDDEKKNLSKIKKIHKMFRNGLHYQYHIIQTIISLFMHMLWFPIHVQYKIVYKIATVCFWLKINWIIQVILRQC